ncbi:type II toxin-antitoxin system RelE family toxin [Algiphilus aromaticivorans]|uniref:type II toxin-antitoxin system RelE family toxin n=1 Tax=Algiphilus aromaticivorans TaxID=382454 RepID=UPI0005C26319|nr:type II toxin-antitoxin system RelE/ParE family toxin [Algiphilus aromaticivorans]
MTWTIEFETRAAKEFRDLDTPLRRRVRAYLEGRVLAQAHPRRLGKALKGRHTGLWRYRVGDVRGICELRDTELVVLVIRIAHRGSVYE